MNLKTTEDLIVAVQHLLQKNKVETQEEICDLLQKKGFHVNQAKISRILHKIGAIKIAEGKKTIYRLPTELVAVSPDQSLKFLVLNIAHNESTIVIQTAPGSAQLVARILDLNDLEILGTVAGDDTIFIAPTSTKQIQKVFQQIYKILFGSSKK
jgi:transcriptional regulator of arginine metabolism